MEAEIDVPAALSGSMGNGILIHIQPTVRFQTFVHVGALDIYLWGN